MKQALLVAAALFLTHGCSLKKGLNDPQPISVIKGFKADHQESFIEIKSLELLGNLVKTKVQFKGGCLDDHRFECIYDPLLNNGTDTLRLSLIHKSEDLCFSILKDSLAFEFNKEVASENYTYIEVNNVSFRVD